MGEHRVCKCGKTFWFPGEFWQHEPHFEPGAVVNFEPPPVSTVVQVKRGRPRVFTAEEQLAKKHLYQAAYYIRRKKDKAGLV